MEKGKIRIPFFRDKAGSVQNMSVSGSYMRNWGRRRARKERGMEKKEEWRAEGGIREDKEDEGRGNQGRVARVGITLRRRRKAQREEIISL